MEMNAFEIIKSCENNWDVNKNDCCKFVNAVAADFGIDLYGTADEIIDALSQNWTFLHGKGIEAKYYADSGRFIVAGLRSSDHNPPRHHGHVVIIVSGNLDRGLYPTGYWGSINPDVARKYTTINYSWNSADRDNVEYYLF